MCTSACSTGDMLVDPPPPELACMGDGRRVDPLASSADGDWARSIAPLTQQVSSSELSWSCTPASQCSPRSDRRLQLTMQPRDRETCAIYHCDITQRRLRSAPLSERAKYCTRSLARAVFVRLRSEDGTVSIDTEATLISHAKGRAKVSAVIGANIQDADAADPVLAERLGVDSSWRVQQDVDMVLDETGTRGELNMMLIDLHPGPHQVQGRGGWRAKWSTPRRSR
jgi:hypothetical protein